MSESLLEKYPHLKLLTKLKKGPVLPLPVADAADENGNSSSTPSGRISLLGPGVGSRSPLVPLHPPPMAGPVPRTKVYAEDLFAASLAADDDQWLQFQVEEAVPAKQQLDQLKMWLMANSPSTITRSSGVGWIAVKFKDKGKKVLEAKAAWDSYEEEKSMEVVNNLADQFKVKGGKWLCHLPTSMIDQVWAKLATTLMCGGLGPSVYMVKVSPVQDVRPEQSKGEHVICVYNTDYKDTEQVMRVENLMRSAGVTTILTYKPDIFSALGIYRNNKWGFRPTIYSSRVMLMEGRSRVETVGTSNWYYNSSKGLQYPAEGKEVSRREEVKGVGKENKVKISQQEEVKVNMQDKSNEKCGQGNKFSMGRIEDLKTVGKAQQGTNSPSESKIQLPVRSLDDKNNDVSSGPGDIFEKKEASEKSMFCMEDMEAMKMSKKIDLIELKLEQNNDKNSAVKKGSNLKNEKLALKKVATGKVDEKTAGTDCTLQRLPLSTTNRDYENGKLRPENKKDVPENKKDVSEEAIAKVTTVTVIVDKVCQASDQEKLSPNKTQSPDKSPHQASSNSKKPDKQKPAWLLKLEQLQMKSLDEMSKTG